MLGTSTARGTIIKIPDATPGLLMVNGQQKWFGLDGVWRSPVAPAINMTVDVELNESGSILGITVVDAQQLTKEKLAGIGGLVGGLVGGTAQQQGKEAAAIAKQGVGALAARMGTSALAATVVLWIAWFFLPAVKLEFFLLNRTFTFWEYLAMNVTNPQSPTGSRGLLGFLGLLCIAAPIARPFVQHAKARYLNAAPLAFVVVAPLLVYVRMTRGIGPAGADNTLAELTRGVQREAAKALLDSLSISAGAVVLLVPAVFLAVTAFRKEPRT